MRRLLSCLLLLLVLPWPSAAEPPQLMSAADLGTLGDPPADARIAYGADPLQFVDLRLPAGQGPHPVMILIHGGCWLSQFNITHVGKLARAFADAGIATWTVEYRRVGDAGGGWPGTFQDIARAADHLLEVADSYDLDTQGVIVAGHSAGGHLALWLAAREKFLSNPLFSSANPVHLRGVLALAPAADLAMLHEQGVCDQVIDKLMGGSPAEVPERYAIASPPELLPIKLPQTIIVGAYDTDWRPVGDRYYQLARAANEPVELLEAPESGHFEMIDPGSSTWPLVRDAAYRLLDTAP